jgi:TetR/AcrR family transcriptional regulator, cholesterol catabolism regulator
VSTKTKKQIVIEEAARLFRDKGYSAASMSDLAKRVGLKQKSSLYNHIDSKEAALQQICFDSAHQFLKGMSTIETSFENPKEQLRALIALHVDIATNDLTSVTVFNDEWRHLTEPELGEFLNLRKNYEDRFRKIIDKGVAQGAFKQVDANMALQTILSALRWVYNYHKADKVINVQKVKEQIALLLLGGLEK